MAREREITVGAINVRIHPHGAERYAALLRDAYRLRQPITVRGESRAVLASVRWLDNSRRVLAGDIARFTEIDLESEWFNIKTRKPAEEDERDGISVPDHLRPNYLSLIHI